MREIKFRGKAVNIKGYHRTNYKNNDWVYGLLTKHKYVFDDNHNLNAEMRNEDGVEGIEVDENTLGQYTGLKDKNGVEIYDDDIVKVLDFQGNYHIGKVVYSIDTRYRIVGDLFNYALALFHEDAEVIGNIYDNPELLEVNDNDK